MPPHRVVARLRLKRPARRHAGHRPGPARPTPAAGSPVAHPGHNHTRSPDHEPACHSTHRQPMSANRCNTNPSAGPSNAAIREHHAPAGGRDAHRNVSTRA